MTLQISPAYLTDDELAAICRPLRQHAARVRFLVGLGLPVDRRPDGSPLVARAAWDRRAQAAQNAAPAHTSPKWTRRA